MDRVIQIVITNKLILKHTGRKNIKTEERRGQKRRTAVETSRRGERES